VTDNDMLRLATCLDDGRLAADEFLWRIGEVGRATRLVSHRPEEIPASQLRLLSREGFSKAPPVLDPD
jgi:hypothetical protein